MSSWKPENYQSLSAYLISPDPERLIAFLTSAFDAALLRRFDRPDGSLMHAEVRIDDSVLMIGGGATDAKNGSVHLHLYVPDALSSFERAVAAGAEVVQKPERKRADDDLRGGVRDFSGNTWWIASV